MGYINRDGIGPHRIEILKRIERGEIKTPNDCGKSNPIPLLMMRNLVDWRNKQLRLTFDGRMLLQEVAEEEGEVKDRPPSMRETWCDRVKGVLPLLPEQFKSNDVRLALNEEWEGKTLSAIAISLRLLERQGLVRCVGRDEQSLIWDKMSDANNAH